MAAVVTTLHVVVCVFLVAVVLLQRGRGAQVGAVFGGGGGGTMFGSRGAGNFLTKLTTGSAIVFMITSLSLSYLGLSGSADRLQFDEKAVEAEQPAPPLFEDLGSVPVEEAAPESAPAPPAGEPEQPAP